jgi:hypothetical protein
MAYVNQEKKQKIAAALKLVVPAGWKYSLAVRNHSTIVCTISKAPVDLIAAFQPERPTTSIDVNVYYVGTHCKDAATAEILQKIVDALNTDNFDKSDIMTDYFNVGHYVDLNIGRWDRPFVVTTPAPVAA